MHLKVSNPTRLQKQLEIERQNFGLKSTEAIWKWPKQIQVNFFGPFLRLDKKRKSQRNEHFKLFVLVLIFLVISFNFKHFNKEDEFRVLSNGNYFVFLDQLFYIFRYSRCLVLEFLLHYFHLFF